MNNQRVLRGGCCFSPKTYSKNIQKLFLSFSKLDGIWYTISKMTIPIIELALPSKDLETEIKNSFLNFPRRLPSWLFYDKAGSDLFVEITKQPEYYLTNAEFEILAQQSRVMLEYIEASSLSIIELGAGDGHKSFQLIGEFLKSFPDLNYYPIDISMASNQNLKSQWLSTFPGMTGAAITADYIEGLSHLRKAQSPG